MSTLSAAKKLFGIDTARQTRYTKVINWLTIQAKYYIKKRKLFFQADLPLIGFLAKVRANLT